MFAWNVVSAPLPCLIYGTDVYIFLHTMTLNYRLYFWKSDYSISRLCFWMTNSFHTGSNAHKDKRYSIKHTNCHPIALVCPRLTALPVF